MSSKFSKKANDISKILAESSMMSQKLSLQKQLEDIYSQYESKGFKMMFLVQDPLKNKVTELYSHQQFRLSFAS